MAYNYFCTYCGKELNQEIVYFNMFPVLTGNSTDQFSMLRFRLTKKELEKLRSSGTKQENGYSLCRLSFSDVMQYIGNSHNNNNPDVQGITLQDVDAYIEEEYNDSEEEFSGPVTSNDSLFGEDSAPAVETDEQNEEAGEKEEEKTFAKGILSLEKLITKNENILQTRNTLRSEFRTLRGVFAQGESYEFELNLDSEDDNDGKPVLIGYTANAGSPRRLVVEHNRLCSYCGKPVIEHAGTAEHKTITFIGDQKAGKTSTIVSLAHYASRAAADGSLKQGIWKKCASVGGIDFMELVSKDPAQQHDLKLYQRGIAPKKTKESNREDAYSVSFRLKNTCQNKHYLLTLTDLPGELFDNQTGRLKTENILEKFPAALACDLFVLCFDTETAKNDRAEEMVQKAGAWTNDIQKLRQTYNQINNRDKGLMQKIKGGEGAKALCAPVMVLYTKCEDLENPEIPLEMGRAETFDRIARMYMYDKERRRIDNHACYRYLGDRLAKYDMVANAYQARLRCSPFGFAAPNELYIKEHPEKFEFRTEKNEQTGEEEKIPILPDPMPRHIDLLMRWLLMVSGCVPVPAEFRPDPEENSTRVYQYNKKYLLTHTQYRMLNPGDASTEVDKDADLHEALARCYLFENPGRHDSAMVEDYDNWALLLIDRMRAKTHRN